MMPQKAYPYDEFSDCAADIAHILTGKRHAGISDDKAKQLYIKYLGEREEYPTSPSEEPS